MAHEGALNATLEIQIDRSEQVCGFHASCELHFTYPREAALVRDVKVELETTLNVLSGKGKGIKTPRGLERKKMWEEVRELRKEWVLSSPFDSFNPH